MFFILQNEPVGRDPVQNAIIQDVLDHNKYSHSYEYDGGVKTPVS